MRSKTGKKNRDDGISHGTTKHVGMLVARMLMHGRQLLRSHFLGVNRSQWLFVGVPGFLETPNKFFCQRGPLLGVEFGIYSLRILFGNIDRWTCAGTSVVNSASGLQL